MFLADASFIVSPFAKTPERRAWAQNVFKRHRNRLWTTAAALAEASHRIGDFKIVAKIINDYRFAVDVEEEKSTLAALLEKYAPEMDIAHATLVRATELFPSFKIITADEYFNWYRRNRDENLPVLWIP